MRGEGLRCACGHGRLCFALAPSPASAQFTVLWTWPGLAPCDGTLQACIDAAYPGDTVEIASPGPIDERSKPPGGYKKYWIGLR